MTGFMTLHCNRDKGLILRKHIKYNIKFPELTPEAGRRAHVRRCTTSAETARIQSARARSIVNVATPPPRGF